MWREHDEYIVRKRREREMEVINRRLKFIEEKLGIDVPEDIECGFLI